MTNGHGEADARLPEAHRGVRGHQRQPVDAPIPDDVDAIIVPGPKQPFDDKGRHEIDAFLMKGKGAIFMVDGMAMSAPRTQGMPPEMMAGQPKIGQPNDTGLGEILEKYGFKVGQDFVLDTPKVPGPIDLPDGRKMLASVPVYVAVKVPEDKDLSVLDHVTALVFPFGSSVDLVGPLAGGKTPRTASCGRSRRRRTAPGRSRGCSSSRRPRRSRKARTRARSGWPTRTRGR